MITKVDINYMKEMRETIDTLAGEMSKHDADRYVEAFEFAQEAHGNQLRKSGKPYISHPVAVSKKLWSKYQDVDLAIAGLLHDTTEDCEVEIDVIYKTFGDEVGFMVDVVDKKRKDFYNSDVKIADKIDRLLYGALKDVRVILLKIADREHNINTLKYLHNDKQVRMAFETQAVYKPLKHVLRLYEQHTIEEVKGYFVACLIEKNVSTPQEIKGYLYHMSFGEFSDEMFDLVYNNSHKIVWEIEDKTYLEELSKNKEFEDHVHVESMWTDGEAFKATFTFDTGYVMDKNGRMKVSSYKQ